MRSSVFSRSSPIKTYRKLVADGRIRPDPAQLEAVDPLQRAYEFVTRPAVVPSSPSLMERWGFRKRPVSPPHSANVYMYGDVGSGKSMLADMFYECVLDAGHRATRTHFHSFMLECHGRMHQFRKEKRADRDPHHIVPLAQSIADETQVLCFDEFQVSDVADAMILKQLFEELLTRQVLIVCTSNRPPIDLYKGGLNRPLFEPFIDMVHERFHVHDLSGGVDYRLVGAHKDDIYLFPHSAETKRKVDDMFVELTHGESVELGSKVHVVGSRSIRIPKSARGVALFHFDEICRENWGASDYLAIAREFHSIIVINVPQLRTDEAHVCRRLITLIDVLYEHKVKLIMEAQVAPKDIYEKDSTEVGFAFARCVSRLMEMQTTEYLQMQHKYDKE